MRKIMRKSDMGNETNLFTENSTVATFFFIVKTVFLLLLFPPSVFLLTNLQISGILDSRRHIPFHCTAEPER